MGFHLNQTSFLNNYGIKNRCVKRVDPRCRFPALGLHILQAEGQVMMKFIRIFSKDRIFNSYPVSVTSI